MNDNQRDDANLVKSVLSGEVHLFGALVEKYEALMYRFLLPQVRSLQEVEDISQEAFMRAFRYLASFDLQKKFSTWLLKIARNLVLNSYQKNVCSLDKVGYFDDFVAVKSVADPKKDPVNQVQSREEFRRIFSDMLELPEDLRIPLLLRVLQEISYDEIAEILEIPVQTVKNRIFKARKTLREKRDACYGL